MRFGFEQSNGYGLIGDPGFNDGSWHHVTATRSAETGYFNLFIDGLIVNNEYINSGDFSSLVGTLENDYNFYVGVLYENFHGPFEGVIDELVIYDYVLNHDEIQARMFNSLSGNEQGLVGYWNFNEGSGSILTDLSGNGNGSNGATWVTGAPLNPPAPYLV